MNYNKSAEDYLIKFEQYKIQNKDFLENHLVQSFLKKKENYDLFMTAICFPSKDSEMKLDIAFKKFYFNIRFTSYISAALYFNAVNYDKKHRKLQTRYPLTVDKPVGENEEQTFKNMISDVNAEIEIDDILQTDNIIDYIGNPSLCKAVDSLTKKQKEILDLVYVKGLSDSEIALYLNKSQQVVSKTHKKALGKLHDFLIMRGENHDSD